MPAGLVGALPGDLRGAVLGGAAEGATVACAWVRESAGLLLGVTTARSGGDARSDMRFPQFVQNMIPAGLSHPQLPQRMPPQ